MKQKIILTIITLFLFLFFTNYISAENVDFKLYQTNNLPDLSNDVSYPSEDMLMRNMRITTEQYIQLLEQNAIPSRNGSVPNKWATSPRSGNVRIPVLLVEFADRNHADYMTRDLIDDIFNDPNYLGVNGISVNEFWNKQSYGDLNVTFDVLDWRRLSGNATNTSYSFPAGLGLSAINLYNSNNQGPDTNFAQYDADNDGRIDGFVIIFASNNTNTPIAPGQTAILKEYTGDSVDGKYLGDIATVSDILPGGSCTIGQAQTGIADCRLPSYLVAHEFAHILGLPDFYVTSGVGTALSTTFMSSPRCTNKPINMDVWSRYFLGWVNPVTVTIESELTQTLRSINDYPDAVILRNNTMNGNEFYIFENRYISDSTDNLDGYQCMKYTTTSTWGLFTLSTTYNVNGGILAYHVDENYINSHYAYNPFLNNIMSDPDNNYYNDTISHPGIVWEQNRIDGTSANLVNGQDFYTSENTVILGQTIYFKYFDNNTHYFTPDVTTIGYNLQPNNLSMEVLSPSGPSMQAIFKVATQLASPTSNYQTGTYTTPISVVLSAVPADASIRYTLDGSEPTTTSTLYTAPIQLNNGITTLKAKAFRDNYYASETSTFVYTINIQETVVAPTANLASGIIDYNSQIILSTITPQAIIRYTLDGSEPIENSTIYSTPITITQTTTLKAKAFRDGWLPSATSTYNYQVLVVNNPVSSLPSGNYNYGTTLILSTTTSQASIYYTIDETTPNQNSTLYTTPIAITEDFTLKAIAYRQGYAPSQVTTYNYTTTAPLQNIILSFTFQGINAQTTIDNDFNTVIVMVDYGTDASNLTPIITIENGATINPPSGVSQNFSSPVNYTVSSASGSRVYSVHVMFNAPIILPPVASISGGTYDETQVVTLTSPTPGTTIRYTLDGSEPNRLTSLYYQGPITISSTTTLKAKAYMYVGPIEFSSENDSRSQINNSKNISNITPAFIEWYTSPTATEEYIISIQERLKKITITKPIENNEIIKTESTNKTTVITTKER